MKFVLIMKSCIVLSALFLLTLPFPGYAFESGSTGSDGEFNPTADIELPLPPSGIFNFTNVHIPAGVRVTLGKNVANTPVVILATGNVVIEGEINIDGGNSTIHAITPGPDDGKPGVGGPGGYDGGKGGLIITTGQARAGKGHGPGGGIPNSSNLVNCSPAGASYGTPGQTFNSCGAQVVAPLYGSPGLIPLLGGSGGAGANGGNNRFGGGGGGGGGAILIAATGTITITGTISAKGGGGGQLATGIPGSADQNSGRGGEGTGGAIRLVATTVQGEGTITAIGGNTTSGANGGAGRIRIEAENMLRVNNTTPAYSFSAPFPAFIANLPALRISSVGGVSVPVTPTGFRDVELPGLTTNPVTVEFTTTDVPLGTTVSLSAAPERGLAVTATSTPVSGSLPSGTASVDIELPNGNSTLFAQTSFTVTASLGQDFSRFAQGELVEQVKVSLNDKGESETTFITATGNEFTWPSNAVAMQ